jgi:hypothetical protein
MTYQVRAQHLYMRRWLKHYARTLATQAILLAGMKRGSIRQEMMMSNFMWTFEGVMQAIGVGFVLIVFLLFGLILLMDKISRWFKKVGKK